MQEVRVPVLNTVCALTTTYTENAGPGSVSSVYQIFSVSCYFCNKFEHLTSCNLSEISVDFQAVEGFENRLSFDKVMIW